MSSVDLAIWAPLTSETEELRAELCVWKGGAQRLEQKPLKWMAAVVNRLTGDTQSGKQRNRVKLELWRLALPSGIRRRSAFLGCLP